MESEFSIDIPEHVINSEKLSARGNKIIDYIFEPAIVVAVVLSIIFFRPPIQLSDSFAAFYTYHNIDEHIQSSPEHAHGYIKTLQKQECYYE